MQTIEIVIEMKQVNSLIMIDWCELRENLIEFQQKFN